jgi:DNA-binding CsgD family transcriptional regulator
MELSYQLEGVVHRADYLRTTAEMLHRLVGADTVGCNAVDLDAGQAEVSYFPSPPWGDKRAADQLLLVSGDHPMLRSYMADYASGTSLSPRRLSDVATHRELRRSRTYTDMLRPLGTEYQLTVLIARISAAGGRSWVLNRCDRDFSEADRELATALQPMLWLLDRAIDDRDPAVARRGEVAARVGVTDRELEILRHVGTGLTADAIGRLLRISPRTVRKHLENAYRKLDCNDRLLAVQRARDLALIPVPRPLTTSLSGPGSELRPRTPKRNRVSLG